MKVNGYEIKPFADLSGVNLRYANLCNVDLKDANLQGADLRGAHLQGADLRYANLQHTNLQDADLRNADLRGVDLRRADLQRADLRDADIDFASWPLWCGSFNVKVDDRLLAQLLCHIARLDTSECTTDISDIRKKYGDLTCKYRHDVDPINS